MDEIQFIVCKNQRRIWRTRATQKLNKIDREIDLYNDDQCSIKLNDLNECLEELKKLNNSIHGYLNEDVDIEQEVEECTGYEDRIQEIRYKLIGKMRFNQTRDDASSVASADNADRQPIK